MAENRILIFLHKHLTFIIFLLVLIVLLIIYQFTKIFNIENISIYSLNNKSLQYINESNILNSVQEFKGLKYFKTNPNVIVKTVENVSPFVKSVLVFKEFPNKLSIHILERTPFLSLKIDDKCILLDIESFVLNDDIKDCVANSKEYQTVLVNSDDPKIQFTKGEGSNYHQLEKIQQVIMILNEYKLGVNKVNISKNIASFNVSSDKTIRLSFNQDVKVQLIRLVSIFNEFEKKNYKYTLIDLRSERPTIK